MRMQSVSEEKEHVSWLYGTYSSNWSICKVTEEYLSYRKTIPYDYEIFVKHLICARHWSWQWWTKDRRSLLWWSLYSWGLKQLTGKQTILLGSEKCSEENKPGWCAYSWWEERWKKLQMVGQEWPLSGDNQCWESHDKESAMQRSRIRRLQEWVTSTKAATQGKRHMWGTERWPVCQKQCGH